MTEPRTREIQLTGKQLVFVFMSTLVVAVVVFLLGVWVGRGIATSPADRTELAAAGASEAAGPKSTPVDSAKLSYPDVLQGSGSGAEKSSPPASPPVGAKATDAARAPAPVPAPPAATAAPPPPTTTPAPADEPWVVQVSAFSSKANADRMAAELKTRGYVAFVTPGPLFRVRIGPFAERAAADQVAGRLRKDPKGYDPRVINTR